MNSTLRIGQPASHFPIEDRVLGMKGFGGHPRNPEGH